MDYYYVHNKLLTIGDMQANIIFYTAILNYVFSLFH